ncbi:hypothetical protein MPLDJ20_20067 [Mesorhizobium plurifarium]|uniref:Uncharacterized protein n=1 Tax=Mesorhizobium plurifarium TaxID=69974 RepID=A0A090F0R6_MESPL|nr:hypothetical protein MPLDJ20_20067 [Mesorhizobium plurifarium]
MAAGNLTAPAHSTNFGQPIISAAIVRTRERIDHNIHGMNNCHSNNRFYQSTAVLH